MSFEGYYLKKCKNNHIFEYDVYSSEETTCPTCKEPFIKTHLVDCTNGITQKQLKKIHSKFEKA